MVDCNTDNNYTDLELTSARYTVSTLTFQKFDAAWWKEKLQIIYVAYSTEIKDQQVCIKSAICNRI